MHASFPFLAAAHAWLPLLAWFVVGLVVGTAAALLARGPSDEGLFLHVVVGVAAALLMGGWLAPRLGLPVGRPLAFLLGGLGLSLFGAVAAAWAIQSWRQRGEAHPPADPTRIPRAEPVLPARRAP